MAQRETSNVSCLEGAKIVFTQSPVNQIMFVLSQKKVFPSGCNAHVTGFIGIWETSLFFYAKCLKCDAPGSHFIVLYLPPCRSFFNKCKYLWRRCLFCDWIMFGIFYLSCFWIYWIEQHTDIWMQVFILGQLCY